jgi:hypothetical protein
MTHRLAFLLLALLVATPGFARAQQKAEELSPREEFMVLVGVGSGYMSALCNLEKDGVITTAIRARAARDQLRDIAGNPATKTDLDGVLAGMKGTEEDREMCPTEVLPPRRK